MTFHVPNQYRVTKGPMASENRIGNNGAFLIPKKNGKGKFACIAGEGAGWEHVSVRVIRDFEDHTPTWGELCEVKSLFWDPEDLVVQFHPPESEYVNTHPHVLHLWRKQGTNDFCERPPGWMV